MRSDNQAAAALLQAFKIGKCAHIFGSGRKIEQEHVLAFDRPLDAGDQHHAALGGIGPQVGDVQLLVMQGDSERAVAKRGRAVNQVGRRVRNRVVGVVGGVGMQLDFQHRCIKLSGFVPVYRRTPEKRREAARKSAKTQVAA